MLLLGFRFHSVSRLWTSFEQPPEWITTMRRHCNKHCWSHGRVSLVTGTQMARQEQGTSHVALLTAAATAANRWPCRMLSFSAPGGSQRKRKVPHFQCPCWPM